MKKIYFSADAHGSTYVWRKWISVVNLYNPDVLILAGDLTGKAFVPLIKQSDGSRVCSYFGGKYILKTEAEAKDMMERLESAGAYSFLATPDEVNELKSDEGKLNKLMDDEIRKRLQKWMEMLVEKVDTKKVMTIAMPGNDDFLTMDQVIKDFEDRGVIYPLEKVVKFPYGYEMISLDYVNPTPWNTDREMDEKALAKKVDELVSKTSDPHKAVFNFHCPPYETQLDMAPKLDKNMRPVMVAGDIVMIHCGSKAIRAAVEKYQPLIGLHGHIHESFASDKLKNTPVVNPGSEYSEGILRGFIIELTETGLGNYWKVEG
jgi:Icc-related predicted phosphoesterase